MKVCFRDKRTASEYAKVKSKLTSLELLIFPSVIDHAERARMQEELQKLEARAQVLYEPWHDFIPKLRSWTKRPRYRTIRTISYKQYPFKLTEEELVEFVESLKRKYPGKGYKLESEELFVKAKRGVGTIRFHIITRSNTKTINPPIYFDLASGRCYIPKHFVEKYPRLSSSVVLYRLHPLGIV